MTPAEKGEITVGQGGFGFLEFCVGGLQQCRFQTVKLAVVHTVGWQTAELGETRGFEQAGFCERGEVDEIGIAGKRGETLVGRIAVTGRAERTNLPVLY